MDGRLSAPSWLIVADSLPTKWSPVNLVTGQAESTGQRRRLKGEKGTGEIHAYIAAFARTTLRDAVATAWAAIQPWQQQANPAHTDFEL